MQQEGKNIATELKVLMSFLIDTKVWGNLGTYNTEDKEIVGVRVAVPKPEKLAVEPSTNITWG